MSGPGGAGRRRSGTARYGGQGGGCPDPLRAGTAASGCELARTQALARPERRGRGGGGAAAAARSAGPRSRGRPVPSRSSGSGQRPPRPRKTNGNSFREPCACAARALSPPPARGTSGLVVRAGRAARGRTRSRDYSSRQPLRAAPSRPGRLWCECGEPRSWRCASGRSGPGQRGRR